MPDNGIKRNRTGYVHHNAEARSFGYNTRILKSTYWEL